MTRTSHFSDLDAFRKYDAVFVDTSALIPKRISPLIILGRLFEIPCVVTSPVLDELKTSRKYITKARQAARWLNKFARTDLIREATTQRREQSVLRQYLKRHVFDPKTFETPSEIQSQLDLSQTDWDLVQKAHVTGIERKIALLSRDWNLCRSSHALQSLERYRTTDVFYGDMTSFMELDFQEYSFADSQIIHFPWYRFDREEVL